MVAKVMAFNFTFEKAKKTFFFWSLGIMILQLKKLFILKFYDDILEQVN